MTTAERFEELVADALDTLPAEIVEMMSNVEIVIEDEPSAEKLAGLAPGGTLLGLYEGIPLTERGQYAGALPDKITIFRIPLTRYARSPDAIRDQVRRTVMHEIAHHFGIDDRRLEELDRY